MVSSIQNEIKLSNVQKEVSGSTKDISDLASSSEQVKTSAITSNKGETVLQTIETPSATPLQVEVPISNQDIKVSSVTISDTTIKTNKTEQKIESLAKRAGQETTQKLVQSQLGSSKSAPVTSIADEQGIKIQYRETIPLNTTILYAVWGEEQGQNDLIWYNASPTGAAYVDFARHKEYGKYHIHTYTRKNEKMLGVSTLEVILLMPQVISQVTQNNISSFTVTVSKLPSTITSVSIPVWTAKDGQNDLIWYKATKTPIGDYQVLVNTLNHNDEKGLYHIHIYGYSTITGYQIGLVTRTYNNLFTRSDATVSVTNYAENKTTFTVNVLGTPTTKVIIGVQIAVWSEKNGQDDLKWYIPIIGNNTAIQLIDIANHSNLSDNYIVHVYTDYSDGSRVGVSLGTYKINKEVAVAIPPKVSVINFQSDNGKLDVGVLQGTKIIKAIRVAAWSEVNQTNIHWYVSSDIKDGQAIVSVDQIFHKFLKGNYTIHTYIDFSDNTTSGFNLGNYYFAENVKLSASQGNYAILNKIIYLDAGHGGYDSGASYFNQYEKSLNLQMQNRIKDKLESLGYKVVTTRTTDIFVDLLPRSQRANKTLADIFVSLHFNASINASAYGLETYYYEYSPEYPSAINETYHNDSERLRRSASLAQAIQMTTIANTGAKNNGVLRNTFAVLRETIAPSVLVEMGYMSNATEFNNIISSAYQEKLASGIVAGILSYYKQYSI
ncbi:GBS Bsp-like repeat-containing protein [Streptococcus didelphis]|uniref:GBS Bsp-like repeat-containing protein n=2 Tax=Streptococcus didelphis TaxID=102886 RepID=A0ABY9LHL8_9STRE|nr:GBS Bsp-like repeat-containing protein [Streptococcus didelphis]WMB28352.1 GBS Bsp-like repeat-containing protein [Streptococcus didelphis]